MEKELIISENYKGKLCIDYLPCINYAMVLNSDKTFRKFNLVNEDTTAWYDITVTISGDMIESCTQHAEQLQPAQSISFENINLMPVAEKLMSLTEAVHTTFSIEIKIEGKQVASQSIPLLIMAFDQWCGSSIMPEVLAAFVTPNHPCITPIVACASKYLEESSGCRDLNAYLMMNYGRIYDQVESVYRALLDENITYALTHQASNLADKEYV